MAVSIASSVNSVTFTPRCRLHCSACSAVFPGGSFVNGPSVSISKNSLFVKTSKEHPKSGYVSPEFACARLMNASPFKTYSPQLSGLNIPNFCGSEFLGSCFNAMSFLVKTQRLYDRYVYAQITTGLVASRFAACLPRGAELVIATPPGAIIVSTQAEYSREKRE